MGRRRLKGGLRPSDTVERSMGIRKRPLLSSKNVTFAEEALETFQLIDERRVGEAVGVERKDTAGHADMDADAVDLVR